MTTIAFDTETQATRPGCKAPPMACLTWQSEHDTRPWIIHGRDARPLFEGWIRDTSIKLVGHFVAYDLAVAANAWPDLLPEIFAALEADRITDTMLREKLWDIALGRYRGFFDDRGAWHQVEYGLEKVAQRRTGMRLRKDGWRKRYGEFLDIPIDQWTSRAAVLIEQARAQLAAGVDDKDLRAIVEGTPEDVVLYPLTDAKATIDVWRAQEEARRACDPDPFADEHRQSRASWWLTLMCNWGVRTREEGVKQLVQLTDKMIAELEGDLIAKGLIRPDGSADTKKAKARMLEVCGWTQTVEKDANGKKVFSYSKTPCTVHEDCKADPELAKACADSWRRPLKKTDTGDISLSRDACKDSDDPILIDYGDLAQQKAVRSKDIPMIAAGVYHPIHTRIDMAESARTTSSGPALQNLRRLPGIREAIIPREGWVFLQSDYPGLELHTLGQACLDLFGYSTLAQMLNAGIDAHLSFAAKLAGCTYEIAKKNKKRRDIDDRRQIGKVFNFGKPGGLGSKPRRDGRPPTLAIFAKKTYGVTLTTEEIQEYDRQWREMLPEMDDFFAFNGRLCDNPRRRATIMQLRSQRMRGGCSFTQACNTWFQGLGADAAKDAGFEIAKACYVDRKSPLFGSRIVLFIHDEFILETRDNSNAHDAAIELSRIMRTAANRWVPDVPFKDPDPEPLLMRLWSKEAEALFHHETKRLVPWEPALAGMIKFGAAVNDLAKNNPSLRVAA